MPTRETVRQEIFQPVELAALPIGQEHRQLGREFNQGLTTGATGWRQLVHVRDQSRDEFEHAVLDFR